PDPRQSAASNQLPDALLSEHVRRLAVCAAVGAGLWSYGLVMDTIVRPLTVVTFIPRINVAIEIAAIVGSALMFLYVRYSTHGADVKTNAGLGYSVLNAIGVATLNTSAGMATIASMGQLSWNTIVILVSSMI